MYETQPTRRLNVDSDDVAGAVAARRELGLDSELAVINAFLERTGQAIDVRVDQRMALHGAGAGRGAPSDGDRHRSSSFKLAIVSMILAIPLTGVTVAFGPLAGPILALFVWTAIVVINVSFQHTRR